MEIRNLISKSAKLRRNAGEKSLQVFAELYFSHYLKQKMCAFHREFYAMLTGMAQKRGERLAVAAPRNSAKSSIVSLLFVLWSICYKKEGYIILISDTSDQAENFLSHIKTELEDNKLLIESFPDICETGQKPMPPRWTKSEIVTRNGVRVTALGAGQKIRGRRNRELRPSFIILDDVENDENTQSEESRQKLFDWFTKAVLKAGSSMTNVAVVGTIQHYDSLLAKLTGEDKMPGWNKSIYKSVISWAERQDLWQKWAVIFNNKEDYSGKTGKEGALAYFLDNKQDMLKGTSVLWEEKEDYYALMVMREQELESSFDSEKQNEPTSSRESLFNPDEFHYWNDSYRSAEELLSWMGDNAQFLGACDPAEGKSTGRGDYTAIIILARDRRDGNMYVIEADIKKRTPDESMNDILAYCRRYKFFRFVVEGNYFQSLMVKEMERRGAAQGIYPAFETVISSKNKRERIQTLQPLTKNGMLKFHRLQKTLIDQFRYFPKAKFDDGPDATGMAVQLAANNPCHNMEAVANVLRRLGSAKMPGNVMGTINPLTGRYQKIADPFNMLRAF